jgi:hypothetical protein
MLKTRTERSETTATQGRARCHHRGILREGLLPGDHGKVPVGWHAYRRDLAGNLHQLGVPDIVIQAIFRHEDTRTTQQSYIKTVLQVAPPP